MLDELWSLLKPKSFDRKATNYYVTLCYYCLLVLVCTGKTQQVPCLSKLNQQSFHGALSNKNNIWWQTLAEGIPNKTVKVMCVFYFLYILETQNKTSVKPLVQSRTWIINQQPISLHILIYTQNGNAKHQNVIICSLSHYPIPHFLNMWLNLMKILISQKGRLLSIHPFIMCSCFIHNWVAGVRWSLSQLSSGERQAFNVNVRTFRNEQIFQIEIVQQFEI